MFLAYLDHPRELVDIATLPERIGPLGSNWQEVESEQRQTEMLREYLESGYQRGHETAPLY